MSGGLKVEGGGFRKFDFQSNESTPKTIIVAKVGAAAPLPLRGGELLRIVFGLFF